MKSNFSYFFRHVVWCFVCLDCIAMPRPPSCVEDIGIICCGCFMIITYVLRTCRCLVQVIVFPCYSCVPHPFSISCGSEWMTVREWRQSVDKMWATKYRVIMKRASCESPLLQNACNFLTWLGEECMRETEMRCDKVVYISKKVLFQDQFNEGDGVHKRSSNTKHLSHACVPTPIILIRSTCVCVCVWVRNNDLLTSLP